MLNISFSAKLETTTGFTLNTDKLNTGVLGYLETPLNASIRSAEWSRGRDSMLDNFSAGSCRIVFDNRNRLLDPANTSSALYGELYPGRKLTLFMTQGLTSAPVFAGYIDSWTYDYLLSGDATVTVTVLDAFSYLAQQQISSISAPQELSGARVARVLSNIGWPLSKQSIDTGYSTLAAETISGVSVLEYLSKVARTEFGMFFADRSGVLKFRQRNRINTFSDLRVSNVANDVNSYVEDVQFDYSFDRVFNTVTLTNQNISVTASASDATSVATYGVRTEDFNVLSSSNTEMQSLANGIVSLYGYPDFIARQATINLGAVALTVTGEVQTNVETQVVVKQSTVDVGYLTSVYWIPPGSTTTTLMRTNYIPNPSFESGTTGWAAQSSTINRVTSQSYVGTASLQTICTAIDNGAILNSINVMPSKTYSMSVWVKGEAGKDFRLLFQSRDSADVLISTTTGTTFTATGNWQRLTVTKTFDPDGVKARAVIQNRAAGAHTFYIDAALLEESDSPSAYFDGSTVNAPYTYEWSGIANNSESYEYLINSYTNGTNADDAINIEALMITGVRYAASPGSIYVTLNLDYALGYDSLILNDLVKGVLDTGKLGV